MNIAVFCGSRPGNNPLFTEAAQTIGAFIGDNGHTLVYGGSTSGLMGETAKATAEHGGKIIGVMPRFLTKMEPSNAEACTEFYPTETMTQRKEIMFEKADAYIMLPGGPGTLEEAADVVSAARLCLHEKPIIFCNFDHFYDPLEKLIHNMIDSGFVAEEGFKLVTFATNYDEIFAALEK